MTVRYENTRSGWQTAPEIVLNATSRPFSRPIKTLFASDLRSRSDSFSLFRGTRFRHRRRRPPRRRRRRRRRYPALCGREMFVTLPENKVKLRAMKTLQGRNPRDATLPTSASAPTFSSRCYFFFSLINTG